MIDIDKMIKKRNSGRLKLVFISLLCVYIFMLMIYILIIPAQSMVNTAECGMTEHIHTDECYSNCNESGVKFLNCDFCNSNENVIHKHDDFCYDDENNLICSLMESSHEHTSSCYDADSSVICGTVVHQHNEECFSISDENEYTLLVCNTAEHEHTEECYGTVVTDTTDVITEEINYDSSEQLSEDFSEDFQENISLFSENDSDISVDNNEESVIDTSKALDLNASEKLTSISMNYQNTDGIWLNIDNNTQATLPDGFPVDSAYRFRYEYENIDIDDLKNLYNYQLIIKNCIPHWIDAEKDGTFMYNSAPFGEIKIIDGDDGRNYKSVLVIFDKEAVDGLPENTVSLSGKFYILGNIAWENLDTGNKGTMNHPKLNLELQFEQVNLPQKYGRIDIIKQDPVVVDGYLKYTLVVTSLSAVDIPDVHVDDCFTGDTKSFIEEYITDSASEYAPLEITESSDGNETENKSPNILADNNNKSMTWTLGNLKAGETRTLIYYVRTDEYYMGSSSRGELVNNAEVYSDETLKDKDDGVFIPKISVSLTKKELKFDVDSYGSGYITYTINISGDKNNSYDIVNLRLRDYFNLQDKNSKNINNEFKSAVNFINDNEHPLTATSSTRGKVEITPVHDNNLNNAAFDFTIDKLSANEKITVQYSVKTDYLYRYINEYAQLLNTAQLYSEENVNRGPASNYCFASSTTRHYFDNNQWIRKLDGGEVTEDKKVEIPEGSILYKYDGNVIKKEDATQAEFEVKKDSKKYEVILNEKGLWDLSSTQLTDNFTDKEHIAYTGYVKVEQYDLSNDSGNETDVLSKINNATPIKTVWLDIDGKGSFSFTPEQLGLAVKNDEGMIDYSKCYSYRLTYYATPKNMGGMGKVIIANEFSASGEIGIGGYPIYLAHIKFSLSSSIQGTIHYEAYKDMWYYYKEANNNNRHIYWVVKLNGTIPKGLTLQDTPTMHTAGSGTIVNINVEDVDLYRCSSDVDIFKYETYNDFLNNENLLKLKRNDKVINLGSTTDKGTPPDYSKIDFSSLYTDNSDYDYIWGNYQYLDGESHKGHIGEIAFQRDISLKEDEVIYAVIKTDARFPVNTDSKVSETAKVYENKLQLKEKDAVEWLKADKSEAMYVQKNAGAAMKEGMCAYLRDGDKWIHTSTSANGNGNEKDRYKNYWLTDKLDEKGVFAEWLININWDGTIDGMADVCDYLPEGFEPVYVHQYSDYVGTKAKTPFILDIPEFENSKEWKKVKYINDNDKHIYYNSETNEMRFKIDNLVKLDNYKVKDARLGFIVICKVTDPELLLTDGKTTVENTLTVTSNDGTVSTDKSTIDIDTHASIAKTFIDGNNSNTITNDVTGNITKNTTELGFKIVVNPLEYDLSTDSTGTLPPLIDELGENLLFDSTKGVSALYEDGSAVMGYTVQYENNRLIINNLPADKKIIITYYARVNVPDLKKGVNITNKAYWQGYNESSKVTPQINVTYNYNSGGEVEFDEYPIIEIIKADSNNIRRTLPNAKFKIYSVTKNDIGTLKIPIKETNTNNDKIFETTGSEGKFKITASESKELGIEYNKLYCIEEVTAPDGYELDSREYYFAVVNDKTQFDNCGINIKNIDVCYNSGTYSRTILNSRSKISVSKKFKDVEGNDVAYYAGEYRFGIYDKKPKPTSSPLQILTIIYSENGSVSYKLDGLSVSTADFTCAEPDMVYYIYELDSRNRPVTSEDSCLIANGKAFEVSYSSNVATENFTVTNKVMTFNMPATGGMGLKNYYILAVSGILSLITAFFVLKKVKRQYV